MQLVTYRAQASEEDRLGALEGEEVVDLAAAHARAGATAPFPRSMLELLRAEEAGLAAARDALARGAGDPAVRAPLDEVSLRAPLPRPNSMRDFMLVEEHVRNSFGDVPEAWYEIPVYWKGNCDTVHGPDDEVPWPAYTEKLDYELEVAAVIGRRAARVSVAEAESCIAGYTIFNDWSARGPCLTTAGAIDVTSAPMRARVNGEVWSEGTLGAMRFSFAEVIAHLSEEQPLHPGDVLGSGTVGRGCGLELDRWIRPGDVVELEVEGIGVLRNRVAATEPGARPAAARATTRT